MLALLPPPRHGLPVAPAEPKRIVSAGKVDVVVGVQLEGREVAAAVVPRAGWVVARTCGGDLGSSRIVASDIESPNILVNLV